MIDRGLKKENKTLYKNSDELKSSHPCTYQYMASNYTVEDGNPPFLVLAYADENDMSYRAAYEQIERIKNERLSSERNIPDGLSSSSSIELVKRLADLDEIARNSNSFTSRSKKKLKSVYNSARNAGGFIDVHKACAELGLVLDGKPPVVSYKSQMETIDIDKKIDIHEAVNQGEKFVQEGENDDEEDEIDFLSDSMENESSDNTNIPIREYWPSDRDFFVWMYSEFIGRNDISDAVAVNDPTQLDSYRNIKNVLQRSDRYDSAIEDISRHDSIDLPDRLRADLEEAKNVVTELTGDKRSRMEQMIRRFSEAYEPYELLQVTSNESVSSSDSDDRNNSTTTDIPPREERSAFSWSEA